MKIIDCPQSNEYNVLMQSVPETPASRGHSPGSLLRSYPPTREPMGAFQFHEVRREWNPNRVLSKMEDRTSTSKYVFNWSSLEALCMRTLYSFDCGNLLIYRKFVYG